MNSYSLVYLRSLTNLWLCKAALFFNLRMWARYFSFKVWKIFASGSLGNVSGKVLREPKGHIKKHPLKYILKLDDILWVFSNVPALILCLNHLSIYRKLIGNYLSDQLIFSIIFKGEVQGFSAHYNKNIYDHIWYSTALLWRTVQSWELELIADITTSWKQRRCRVIESSSKIRRKTQ